MRMNLVEAPDHAGPAAPPHAPERLRTLLAEGRDAQNDETAQSERAGFSPLKLNLDSYSESKDSNIFGLEVVPEGRKSLLWFSTLPYCRVPGVYVPQ